MLAGLGGVGHDPQLRDARFIASLIDSSPVIRKAVNKTAFYTEKMWNRAKKQTGLGEVKPDQYFERPYINYLTPEDKFFLNFTTRLSRGLYRGLLFGRLPTAIAQFTQLINTAADLGPWNTMRGTILFMDEAQKRGGLEKAAKTFGEAESLFGAAGGAAAGMLFFGPVGMLVAAAVTPASRALKAFARAGIPEDVALHIGVDTGAKLIRGQEFVSMGQGLFHYLDEVGFSSLDAAEAVLRGATFMTAQDVAFRRGYRGMEAVEMGVRGVVKTQFIYDQLARNPFWRNSHIGVLAAPLSSFPLKQAHFIRQLMTQNASDGAPAMVAMTRYLFLNGLVAEILRETSIYATGDAFVPNSLRGRVQPPALSYFFGPEAMAGVRAPVGFESVANFAPGRTPGPQVVGALFKYLGDERDFAEFMDTFVKSFVPFGLVVSDLYRARSRMEENLIRRQEGAWTQATRGGAVGGVVRETTPLREWGRLFGFVSPEESKEMDQERRAQIYASHYVNTYVVGEYERILRDTGYSNEERKKRILELAQTEEGLRKRAMGGIRERDLDMFQKTRLERSFRRLNVPFRELVVAGLRGDPNAKNRAMAMGMSNQEWLEWQRVARRLLREKRNR